MIINVSRRTDIPAFFSDTFLNDLKKGFTIVKNPYNGQDFKVSLKKEDVDCFVFWSKNPRPLLERLEELDGYTYYFQYTLNNYPSSLEPHLPSLEERISTFCELSKKAEVIWRYDPIIVNNEISVDFHKKEFLKLSELLKYSTKRVIISFIDVYGKLLGKFKEVSFNSKKELCETLKGITSNCNIEIQSCAESGLEQFGIVPASCVDIDIIKKLRKDDFFVQKDKSQRKLCRCAMSKDIGSYGTCLHGCTYCYAS